ncbi:MULTISPECIES: RraA family protein [unclassified Arenibacter]|uniref:RraA family protein n=1 Tax=unclassified Arenibacter TaxID=2615047 RepID=UPI000E342EC1|nr:MULTISPECIES: RraA family protein [unclassified Arenibacter]MCM4162665.1 dimethylmenaquinone methyltransferase [Arenibacter sp. A80]RFT58230.1 RraA family protein [Arenibacter sp. P308M17]
MTKVLSHGDLLELKRWNTPTIYNGWEQITKYNTARDGFNLEPLTDYMPQMGPMIGYAVTVEIQPGNEDKSHTHGTWEQYFEYIASIRGPKIVVVQDLDKPNLFGAFWGEVNSNSHKALGCVGTIIDGGIRDIDEMQNAGFKALARGLCVGHAYSHPIRWNCDIKVFGCKIKPGQLIHADKHGFLVIPENDQLQLLDAVRFMDSNECKTVIPASRNSYGLTTPDILKSINEATNLFRNNAKGKFNRCTEFE